MAYSSEDLSLRKVPEDTVQMYQAASLDGSPPAYYITKATDPALASTFVLYFKGGGWCYDEVECLGRSKTNLGSSTNLPDRFGFSGGPSASDPKYNSLAGANRVILWYTDGASFSGYRQDPVNVNGSTIYFRGFANLLAILHDLELNFGLKTADHILVSGGSAGGLAAYLHSQYISDRYTSANVLSAPASGFFLNDGNAAKEVIYPNQVSRFFAMNTSINDHRTQYYATIRAIAFPFSEGIVRAC